MTEDALAGLTVLEYPDSVAIRYCGKLSSAHGARVIQMTEPSPVGVVTAARQARRSRPGRTTARHDNPRSMPDAPIHLVPDECKDAAHRKQRRTSYAPR